MHIGFLTTEYPDFQKPEGGLGNYIRKTALELVRRGHNITVFVCGVRQIAQNDMGIELLFVPKATFHWRFKQNTTLKAWLELVEDWLNAQRMRRTVLLHHERFPLNIVQTPNYKMPGYMLCHNGYFPLICRCSSYSPLLRAATDSQRKLPHAIADWFEAKQVIDADAAFAPSRFISYSYDRFEAIKTSVIRTPVELPVIAFDDSIYHELADGKKYLLYFGTLNRVKGVDILIEVAQWILSRNRELTLLFVGRNDLMSDGKRSVDMIQSKLMPYIREKRVVYSPPLPKAQLYPLIQNSFGVILPSRVDNYPNACLEAFSLGIPVVGTYDSSLDEMIVDGRTGFLANNSDANSLCEAINRLLSRSELQRQKMLENIRASIASIVEEDRVGQLMDFYQDTIDRFKSSRS